jgi:hypothetical protein
MGRGARAIGVAAVLWLTMPAAVGVASPSPLKPAVSASVNHARITGSKPVVISGKVTGEPLRTRVDLYSNPYPYRRAKLVRSTTTASGGRYSFTVRPDRNTRYRVSVHGTAAQATTRVGVIAQVIFRHKNLPLGRLKLAVLVVHPAHVRWWHAKARWWFAGPHGHFSRGPITTGIKWTRTRLLEVVRKTLPAGRYRWRVCIRVPNSKAFTVRHPNPGCRGQSYHGKGSLPYGFPSQKRIHNAEHYLASRGGHTALAVVDTEGRMYGVNLNQQFITGSVVKAMLLVAYLRRLDRMGQHYVDSNSNSFLSPMIEVSDNNAATHCWDIVGNSGLYEVAHAAGMTHFSVDTGASWGSEWGAALITAADQARFFFYMDRIIPHEFVHYARYLLSHIQSYEAWGIPAEARPLGYTVFFKGGWRPSPDTYLVHQIARLEKGKKRLAIAVMTDGDPDMGYGIDTIQGTTRALLR